MERRYATIEGMAVNIEDHGGTGAPVVFVHGLAGSAGNWSLVAPRVARFARPIAVDLPGHGRSGPARIHDLDTHVRTVIGVIETGGFDPAALVGNSMGGLVAEIVAARRPDLVASLLLLSPATPPARLSVPSNPALAARLLLTSLPGVGRRLTASRSARLGPRRQVEEMLRVVMEDPAGLPDEALKRAVALATLRQDMPWAAKAVADSAKSIRRLFVRRRQFLAIIDRITVPTTLVFGAGDQVVIPGSIRWLAAHRPDWHSVELSDAGHTVMLERPGIVIRELARQMGMSPETGAGVEQPARAPSGDVPEHLGGRGDSGVFGPLTSRLDGASLKPTRGSRWSSRTTPGRKWKPP